jgi:hypothetical protein
MAAIHRHGRRGWGKRAAACVRHVTKNVWRLSQTDWPKHLIFVRNTEEKKLKGREEVMDRATISDLIVGLAVLIIIVFLWSR